MKLTIPQLISTLESFGRGAKICTVITRTTPKMTVKHRIPGEPNPYIENGGLVRIAHRCIILGANYSNLVNVQRDKEGNEEEFVAEELWKGKGRKHGLYTVYHVDTGEIYFAYKPSVDKAEHLPTVLRSGWYHNGHQLTEAEELILHNYLPLPSKGGNQGVEKQIFWQTLKLSSIVSLCYGKVYDLDHSIEPNVRFCPVREIA